MDQQSEHNKKKKRICLPIDLSSRQITIMLHGNCSIKTLSDCITIRIDINLYGGKIDFFFFANRKIYTISKLLKFIRSIQIENQMLANLNKISTKIEDLRSWTLTLRLALSWKVGTSSVVPKKYIVNEYLNIKLY
jgi:hypothetical protein